MPSERKRIYVADDEDNIRQVVRTFLTSDTPYCSFVFSLIVGHYILFDKRKNNGPDDIISLYYKEPEYKKKKLLL